MDAVNGMVQAQEQAEALTKHAQAKDILTPACLVGYA